MDTPSPAVIRELRSDLDQMVAKPFHEIRVSSCSVPFPFHDELSCSQYAPMTLSDLDEISVNSCLSLRQSRLLRDKPRSQSTKPYRSHEFMKAPAGN